MPRKANATISSIACPISGDVAADRKEASGRLYFVSPAGKITPYTEAGQTRMIDHAIIWGPDGPPLGTPDWITQGRASPPLDTPGTAREPAIPPADEATPALMRIMYTRANLRIRLFSLHFKELVDPHMLQIVDIWVDMPVFHGLHFVKSLPNQ